MLAIVKQAHDKGVGRAPHPPEIALVEKKWLSNFPHRSETDNRIVSRFGRNREGHDASFRPAPAESPLRAQPREIGNRIVSPITVHWLPDLIPPQALAGGVAVVVDVLRATSVMVRALSAGCSAIRPCLTIDEAKQLADSMPRSSVVLAGERRGVPIPGFDLGNSMAAFTLDRCRDRTIVMTTTNGTKAILASLEAESVLIASWLNFGATVQRLQQEHRPIHFVAAGTDGLVSWEDVLLVAALVRETIGQDPTISDRIGNDSALLAWSIAEGTPLPPRVDSEALSAILALGRGGQRVRELGFEADLKAVAHVDQCPIVAELQRDPIRIQMANEIGNW